VTTGNYVSILTHLNHIQELSPQNTSICAQQHIYIYIYLFIYMAATTLQSAQQLGNGLDKVQCLAGARPLLQSNQTGSWLCSCPASSSVGIRNLSPGKRRQNMKLSTQQLTPNPNFTPHSRTIPQPMSHIHGIKTQLHSILTPYFCSRTWDWK
jgi:hypothetical protein